MTWYSRRQVVQGMGAMGLGLVAGCGRLPGQAPPTKVHRIGYLTGTVSASNLYEPFWQGLREYGYVEGHNIVVDYRSAEATVDQLSGLAAELVGLPVDLIAAEASPAIHAAKQATSTIPIVMVIVADPVEQGLVASLARPGGNITGLSTLAPQLSGKWMELLKEVVPTLSRVAVLWNPDNPGVALMYSEAAVAARSLGLAVQSVEARRPDDLDGALAAVTRGGAEALIELPTLPVRDPTRLLEFAAKSRLPAMHAGSDRVAAGGLMSYWVSRPALARRAAYYVDRILKGAKPTDLPVEQPREFDFIINAKTAHALGLTIPPHVLLQATEVIQ